MATTLFSAPKLNGSDSTYFGMPHPPLKLFAGKHGGYARRFNMRQVLKEMES